jgi:molybdopterin-guanine dinucleotide biosynthesis protein A
LPTARPVVWTCEAPPGGGPVAAIAAALSRARSSIVVVLAADLPFVTADAVERLLKARADAAAVIAVDTGGRDQPLLACYDSAALRAVMPAVPHGASMRSLLSSLEAGGAIRRLDLGGEPAVTWDCDTAAQLTRAQELA